MPKHKVFISYHHQKDHVYKNSLTSFYGNDFVNYSVDTGDIHDSKSDEEIRQIIRDEYIRHATVTIVLIGQDSWGRKHVDWEISSSLRETKFNKRNGVVGIILPTNNNYGAKTIIDSSSIPSRLYKNFQNSLVKLYDWNSNMNLENIIHEAYSNRYSKLPDNSDPLRKRNSN